MLRQPRPRSSQFKQRVRLPRRRARGQKAVGELTDDTVIATKVKAALLQDPGTAALAIGVETFIGRVQLTGFVDSADKKHRAQGIAERVDGVIAVDNALSVKLSNKHFIVMTAVMVIGLFGLSATANSQETFEAVISDFGVTCTSTGQLCHPPFSVSGEIGLVLQVQYFALSTHCSSLRVHLFVDGTLKVTTGFLGWPGAPSPFENYPWIQALLIWDLCRRAHI